MPANDNLEALFQTLTMSALVERFAGAPVSGRPFLAEFQRAQKLAPPGDSVHWDEVRASRGLSRLTAPDSPTKAAKVTDRKVKSAVMVDLKENVDLPARFLYFLRNAGELTDNARAVVDRELENITRRLMNSLEWMCTKSMEGVLDLSAFPGDTELNQTLTYPVLQLDALASWATAGTNLRSSEMPTLVDTFIKKTGTHPVRAIAARTIEGYITANDEITSFLTSGDNGLAARALESSFLDRGSVPTLGPIGFNFTSAHYALDSSEDTETEYLSADRMIVLPEPGETADVLKMAEGRVHIPAGPVYAEIGGTPDNLLAERRGFWSYAEVRHNPPGIRIHAGWKGLPIVAKTNAIMNFDTTP